MKDFKVRKNDTTTEKKKYKMDLHLDQNTLAATRRLRMGATEQEEVAIEEATVAILDYRAGRPAPSACSIVTAACPGDQRRQVQLLNVVLPLVRARSHGPLDTNS